ncbi:hypothetical protein [Pseudalkalibacillus decolorationis]|uniref:hypothetical protein n=1 Tax=Pseudalkalibacillus decolorationis TaxID=163879 RepID=UPI0021472E4B|nr:hypothetical protein [Pseudalkalibacillus decolorationis]
METNKVILISLVGVTLIILGLRFILKKSITIIKDYDQSTIEDKEGLAKAIGLYVTIIGFLVIVVVLISEWTGLVIWVIFAVLVSASSILMLGVIKKYV